MFIRPTLIAFAVAATLAPGPVLARQAQPAAPAPALAPEVAAFDAKVAAFEDRIAAMESEMQAAVASAAGDVARRDAALDVIVARYQPEADAFAAEIDAFLTGRAAVAPEARRPALLETARVMSQQATLAPRMIRDGIAASSASRAPAQ